MKQEKQSILIDSVKLFFFVKPAFHRLLLMETCICIYDKLPTNTLKLTLSELCFYL